MDCVYMLLCLLLFMCVTLCGGDTYSVRVGTEQHVNLVDPRFLSFTIDPKYLFSSSEKYLTKECICMASSLSPAYIRIAGPSTASMVFRNTTISIADDDEEPEITFDSFPDDLSTRRQDGLSVSHKQWEKFVRWARSTGFDLVFALSSDEKTESGMWDPNTALRVLTVADDANVDDIYWQLGYECRNQSIEEYLNDLETLRVIIETFPPGKAGRWQVVGGDITHCLQAESKSDFKDYVTLSNDMMDAILLNGNSSSRELERMSEKDRLQLLKLLSQSSTPLWLTENYHVMMDELGRAADWMTSLGYSARNGFAVHYRELLEKELYEPTLSFYMALLFKNLVGERVLSVDIDATQAMMFAHCTTLRHKPVPGAITLYGINMEDEPARFSIKLSQTEEGGDIMQFILGHDHNGNIVVNGRPMYYEGDIKPVVRRIRPYKTLLITLPSKSFGFWVLANTKVEACQDVDDKINEKRATEKPHEMKDKVVALVKRSVITNSSLTSLESSAEGQTKVEVENQELKARIEDINNNFKVFQEMARGKPKFNRNINRIRRDIFDRTTNYYHDKKSIFDDLISKIHIPIHHGGNLMEKISQFKETNLERLRQKKEQLGSLLVKRSSRKYKRRPQTASNEIRPRSNKDKQTNIFKKSKTNSRLTDQIIKEKVSSADDTSTNNNRNRRSINTKHEEITSNDVDLSLDNEIKKESNELNKILHKVKKISHLPVKMANGNVNDDYYEDLSDAITLNTKISDDSAMVSIHDESNSGILKNTLHDVMGLLGDLNKQLNRFWSAVTVLE